MADLTFLECFDSPPPKGEAGPGADWLAGHSTGFDEGRAAAMSEQSALRAASAQALADLTLTARDAQNLVLDRLAPLFTAIAAQVVPAVLHATLGQRLADLLGEAAAQAARADVTLHAAPDEVAAIAAALAEIAGGGLAVIPDPHLRPGQIVIGQGGAETCLDTARLHRDIAAALAALADPTPRRTRNG